MLTSSEPSAKVDATPTSRWTGIVRLATSGWTGGVGGPPSPQTPRCVTEWFCAAAPGATVEFLTRISARVTDTEAQPQSIAIGSVARWPLGAFTRFASPGVALAGRIAAATSTDSETTVSASSPTSDAWTIAAARSSITVP